MTSGIRRTVAAIVAGALAVVLAACASIPTSGPVLDGDADVASPNQLFVSPERARDDADPEQIVRGFVKAQAAGPATGTYEIAQSYLTDDATAWDPSTQVLVYTGEPQLTVEIDGDTATARGSLSVLASVDDRGVYTVEPPDATRELNFDLTQDAEGRWRIDALENGTLMASINFEQSFQESVLYFPTPDRTYFVPDVRWLPKSSRWQTLAVTALLAGPVEWLQDSVIDVAPPGTELGIASVPVEDGVATVDLTSPISSASPEDRALLLAQIDATLASYPRTRSYEPIRSVELTSGGTPLRVDPEPAPSVASVIGSPLAVAEGSLVEVSGTRLETLESAPSLDGLDPTAFALSGDVSRAADGSAVVVRDGDDRLVSLRQGEDERTAIWTGDDLVAPTVDRFSWVWTANGSGPPSVVSLDGESTEDVTAGWLDDRTVTSIDVSADGARIVVVSAGSGGVRVHVTGVIRDGDGVPTGLAEPIRVGVALVEATEAVWSDSSQLAVLGASSGQDSPVVHLVDVGGNTESLSEVSGAEHLAAGNGEQSLLLVDADGDLSGRSTQGTSWQALAVDVDLVAYPG
ncbi:LpqB family beta-propeller domain-containing protein [Paraoerskovia marina]|uniref:LpqB family beta-propeller domain-containing protein n=1 Tax=Paraoerskovia marina TaxID=545619 RepID=UPI00049225A2|nr:LpqB family beta-propeller domain-containing protein [Paraoerskovia marina]